MGPIEQFSSYHNELGNGFSITDPTTWVDVPGTVVKFTAAALGSGLNSYYNTGVAVGNLFGAEWEERDTYAWLSDMDEDIGQYYKENKEGADLGGFLLGSLLPGTAGVKLFNYGLKSAGLVEAAAAGANATLHTGVRGIITKNFTAQAIADYKQTGALFSVWNKNFVGAAAKGFAKEAANAAVFEVAASAAMMQSPVLEDQDIGDIAWNTLMGSAVGGVIGGAFNLAKVTKTIKSGIREIDIADNALSYQAMKGEGLTPDVKMAYALFNKAKISEMIPEAGSQTARWTRSLEDIDISVRNYSHEMFSNDKAMGNYWADRLIQADPANAALQLIGTAKVSRVGDDLVDYEGLLESLIPVARTLVKRQTQVEALTAKIAAHEAGETVLTPKQFDKVTKQLTKATEAQAKTEGRLATKTIIDPVTGQAVTATQKLEQIFYDLHTGNSFTARPGALNVADVIARKSGETIEDALARVIKE